ncbi:MAG: GDP-mannose 4,6-dehydratase, partial [Candidatus Nealsonbacteria bacterium]|nr:GDP-mannose 4,6-dehydratase [Candidatus Nealsonbacteria bacterium]
MNIFRKKNILITGGAGFIGSWLAKELIDLGAKVTALDLKNSNPVLDGLQKRPILIKGDVRNFNLVKKIIIKERPDLIFHLAAQTIVGLANKDPLLTLSTNIIGTWNILEAARVHYRPKAVIVASSDKAYGDQPVIPYKENMALTGLYPYDASKSSADLLSQMYFKTYQLPVCVVRSANVFGGGDLHFSRIVPDTIKSLLNNNNPVIRSDGKLKRDYLYVKDAVTGYLDLAKTILRRKEVLGQVFNFGTANPYSVKEVVSVILNLMQKKDLKPIVLNKAENEIKNQSLDFAKAKRILK